MVPESTLKTMLELETGGTLEEALRLNDLLTVPSDGEEEQYLDPVL